MPRRRLLWVLAVLLLASLAGTAVQQPAPAKKDPQSGSKTLTANQPQQTPEEREYEAKRLRMGDCVGATGCRPAPLQEEAENTRRDCEKGPILGNFYDCSCVGQEFKKARLAKGPAWRSSDLRLFDYGLPACVSKPRIEAYGSKRCAEQGPGSPHGIPRGGCECVGKKLAEGYAKGPGPTVGNVDNLFNLCMDSCRTEPTPAEGKALKALEDDPRLQQVTPEARQLLLAEANRMVRFCQNTYLLMNFYDCSCLPRVVLEGRLTQGVQVVTPPPDHDNPRPYPPRLEPDFQGISGFFSKLDLTQCISPPSIGKYGAERARSVIYQDRSYSPERQKAIEECTGAQLATDYEKLAKEHTEMWARDISLIDRLFGAVFHNCRYEVAGGLAAAPEKKPAQEKPAQEKPAPEKPASPAANGNAQPQQDTSAQSPPQRFAVRHRHLGLDPSGKLNPFQPSYCEGELTVTAQGDIQYTCTKTDTFRNRCESIRFPPIKEVKLHEGGLRITLVEGGNWDFYGAEADIQRAYQAISEILARSNQR